MSERLLDPSELQTAIEMLVKGVHASSKGKVHDSLRKTVGKMLPILVTLASRSDSDFESSNVSLKENKPDGVNPNFSLCQGLNKK